MAFRLGPFAYSDTGPVTGSLNYTTVVIIHGFGWHGASFQRLSPFAAKSNVRLVVLNRRDYPGSEPFDATEHAQLSAAGALSPGAALPIVEGYMRDRARELIHFIASLVKDRHIPIAQGNYGGIVVCGWSFGALWLTALLANLATFSDIATEIRPFIQRVVLYDPPSVVLGYPEPQEPYSPLNDEALTPHLKSETFAIWVSGYYNHGTTEGSLEKRISAKEPSPTITRMSQEDIQSCFSRNPTTSEGSDFHLRSLGKDILFDTLRKNALCLENTDASGTVIWPTVPLRYLWCDRSPWEIPWGAMCFRNEIAAAEEKNQRIRDVSLIRLAGANHFLHWDHPERLLRALITQEALQYSL